MQTYSEFKPTSFDTAGLGCDNRQDWLSLPCVRNRDSNCAAESNFHVAQTRLVAVDPEGKDHEIHRFGHWACGWFELIIVRFGSAAEREAIHIESELEGYPILDENDLSEREHDEASRVWKECYNVAERIDYIRDNRGQFHFQSFADMLGCIRGNYFAGYASELLT